MIEEKQNNKKREEKLKNKRERNKESTSLLHWGYNNDINRKI